MGAFRTIGMAVALAGLLGSAGQLWAQGAPSPAPTDSAASVGSAAPLPSASAPVQLGYPPVSPPPSGFPVGPPPAQGQPSVPPASYGASPYGYPPGYGPQPYPPGYEDEDDEERPETVPYEPGDFIPAGYRLETQPITGLVIAGAVATGGLWLLSGMLGTLAVKLSGGVADSTGHTERQEPYFLWIPVAGPFVAAGTVHDPAGPIVALLVLDGVLQSAGLAMLIGGAAAQRQVLVWHGGSARLVVGPAGRAMSGASVGLAGEF
jgi:hypothetical protein